VKTVKGAVDFTRKARKLAPNGTSGQDFRTILDFRKGQEAATVAAPRNRLYPRRRQQRNSIGKGIPSAYSPATINSTGRRKSNTPQKQARRLPVGQK